MIVQVKALRGGSVSVQEDGKPVARVFNAPTAFKDAGAWLKAKGLEWLPGSQGVWTNEVPS